MKKTFLSVALIATLFLVNCFDGGPFGGHHHGGKKHFKKKIHRMHKRIASKLDLNESQKESLKQIADRLIEKKKSLNMRDARKKERELMYQSLMDKQIKENELKAVQKQKYEKKSAFRTFQIEQYSAFYKTLTDKQKNELAEFAKDMWEEHQDDDHKDHKE